MQKALPIISWSMALSQEMNTHFSLFTIRISGAAVKNYTTAVDKKYSHMLVHHVSCFSCYFFLTIWNSLNSFWKKKLRLMSCEDINFFQHWKLVTIPCLVFLHHYGESEILNSESQHWCFAFFVFHCCWQFLSSFSSHFPYGLYLAQIVICNINEKLNNNFKTKTKIHYSFINYLS